ncbi:hypothetical protein PFICI_07218 [Pestalotiopsis fici W106-1]|uniref:Major facilitator superfamily (MFS) profile domain-containing protein n=1 Tax=Pestalotiopsis fici (strain W106-1 / CGMCC3.15140) TaxID=1229662 RepID=W3XAP2_PESFW|nr:uncharacterized protein PFICI_07218 [Pestalotiopsis fici W106-1]ETS82216.1 hypothetical protein PFICI_07218 [Pestalotiopsis fici W106-1]
MAPKLSLKLGDGRESPPPPPSSEKTQQRPIEGAAPEIMMVTPGKRGPDPEKTALGLPASDTAPAPSGIVGDPAALGDFGREDEEYISGYKLFAALFGIVSVFFIVLLDFSIISTALPYITSDFHRLQDVGWYGGAYQLSCAALQPLTGKLYTYLSAKRTFLVFVAIFEVGSLLCGVATSSTLFILGRTIAGLGTSGLENGALTLIAGAVPLQKRPLYTGIVFAIGQIGIVVGPLIGGVLTQYANWRWCFYINLPIGAVSILFLCFTHIPDETLKPPFSLALFRSIIPNLDLTGCALFAPATVMFLLALQWGSDEYGWTSPIVIGLFVGSGVTAILFSFWEWRVGENALIPFHLVKKRIVWTSTIHNCFLFITNSVGANYIPIYFQAVKGVGPSLSGVYTLPSILAQLLSLVISGALVTKLGYYLPFGVLGAAVTAVACGLISTWTPDTITAEWIGYQILFGLRGMALQTAVISMQNAVTPAQNAVVMAFLVFVQSLMAAISNIVGNAIFTQTLARQVSILAPSVSPEAALAAGGSAETVRALLPSGSPELGGLLLAYSKSVNAVFYMLLAVGGVCFAASWGMGWVDIRKKAPEEDEA